MSFELSTDGPRLMRFPYPVCWAGATVEECKAVNDFYFTDRILIRRFTELLGHTMERNALDRLDLTAYELLCELLLERNAPPDRQEFHRDDILAIASYLKQSFRHEIDYEELAHRHGLSLRSFFRGMTPLEYRRKHAPGHLLERARALPPNARRV